MRSYSNKISLTHNSRGIYSLDTSIGCHAGMMNEEGGCYNDCYAAKSAKLYGYDFSQSVLRSFVDEHHRREIIKQINKVPLDFIRIGTSGDPSENWEHTINIIKQIETCNKEIVIIARHWTKLTDEQLRYFGTINICVNTSVSALDKPELMQSCLTEYNRLKPFCKSILRIVSCDLNLDNPEGKRLSDIQHFLFKNTNVIDTVLRLNKGNRYIKDGIVNVTKTKFLGKNAIVSKFNKKTYFGKCSTCHEMCGVDVKTEKTYPDKKPITKQLLLFKPK